MGKTGGTNARARFRKGLAMVGCLLAMPVFLAACQPSDGDDVPDPAELAKEPVDYDFDDEIECALNGGQEFSPFCRVQRVKQDDGSMVLVVRHPDGGFRRFLVLTDGRGLEAADGSEEAASAVVDGRLDITVGQDRYRFPATVKAKGQDDASGAAASQ